MKKSIGLILSALLMTASIAYCEDAAKSVNVTDQKPLFTVVQDRVIEVTTDNFNVEAAEEYFSKKYCPEKAGCSCVRVMVNGKVYVGRNYDFYCSDTPAFIVRNNSGKLKTIGIGNSPITLPPWNKDYKPDEKILGFLPGVCCDMINEAGIYCETNIRMSEKQFVCRHTNPGKPRRCTQLFMVTMLTQYDSIDEITKHISDYDWYDFNKLGFQQSFFLCDQKGRAIIVEFAADECRWQEAEYNGNYYINNDWYSKELLPCGEMRVSKELAYKTYVRTEEDIFKMMQQGAYDQFFNGKADPEYGMQEFFDETGYNKETAAKDPEGAIAATKKVMDFYKTCTWQDRIDKKTWESTFIVAANVTDKVLNVFFSEHYGIRFKVEFK